MHLEASLWSSDVIWRHRSWSALVHVMACHLMTKSHYMYLNYMYVQCWLVINLTLESKTPWNFNKVFIPPKICFIQKNMFENVVCKLADILGNTSSRGIPTSHTRLGDRLLSVQFKSIMQEIVNAMFDFWGTFYYHGLTLIPAWISYQMPINSLRPSDAYMHQ